MTTISIRVDKGVNKDLPAAELADGWVSDAKNFRFRNGFAEMWGGLYDVDLSLGPPRIPAIWTSPYGTSSSKFLIYASAAAAAARNASGETTITRYTDGAVISSITRVATTATLTTATNHGRTTGDAVSVYAAYPSQYNGTYTITVTSPTTFTYTMASDPGASASPVGAYSYNVQSAFTASTTARWTGGPFNGLFLANNKNDGLYYWSGDTTVRLRRMPDLTSKADTARAFKNFIVLLGITEGGVRYPQRVAWSAAAEPGAIPAFTPTATNEASSGVDLAETGGQGVDCLPLGDVLIIYMQDARYAMQYVGGNDVFSFTRLPGNEGLVGQHCAVATPVGHVFLTSDMDVMVHNGGAARSVAAGRIKSWLVSSMKSFADVQAKAFLCSNPDKEEVQVWIPVNPNVSSSVYCQKAAVWNWNSDTWSIFDLTDVAPDRQLGHACTGIFDQQLYPPNTPQKQIVMAAVIEYPLTTNAGVIVANSDLGYFFGQMPYFIERTGLDFGDRDVFKAIHRSRWNLDGAFGTFTINHGSSRSAKGTVTYSANASYTVVAGTYDYVNARSTDGRFGAIKASFSGGDSTGKVRSIDLDVRGGAKR